MQVSFRHANPKSGNESFVLKFEENNYTDSHTPCLLVDSGTGVDIDSILRDDEYLVGILLTHAHADHYQTLSENIRDGAEVYAATDTAKILETTLADSDVSSRGHIIDSLTPVDEWEKIHHSLRIFPVPAGHAPGAAGFLIQFKDSGEWRTILATGDFNLTQTGGYPAFTTNLPLHVEAVFLTGATAKDPMSGTQEALESVIELASAGSKVLFTTTGLGAVTQAYRLGHLADEIGATYTINLMGRAAKLYNDLEYDVPNVEVVPEFDSVTPYLTAGSVTIAGPQSPTEGAAGRLYNTLKSDPNGAVVQLTNGAGEKVTDGNCTHVYTEERSHPTESDVDRLVEELDPYEVVVTHQSGSKIRRYRDKYSSYVWAAAKSQWYTLYDGQWRAPPWMTREGRSYIQNKTNGVTIKNLSDSTAIPTPERGDVDLISEGLDLDQFRSVTSMSPATNQPTAANDIESPPDVLPVSSSSSKSATDGGVTTESEQTSVLTDNTVATLERPDNADTEMESHEAQVTTSAQVVDAGGGVTLLRLPEGTTLDDIEHGDEITVTLDQS